jgi:hypothetical protein
VLVDASTMARCMFTSGERKRIDSIASELDETIDEFFADARRHLPAAEWDFLKGYARACISRALEVGTLLRAVAESRPTVTIPYPGRGCETFVRDALAAWRDSFAPVPDVWRLAPIFEKIDGGESRVLADVAALEVMAANRMFISLDEQYQAFFAGE